MADPLLAFFTVMDGQGGFVVKEAPKFDLDLYIQNYRGRTRFDRLFLVGRSSVPLCIDALKAAIAEAKRGRDPQRYREAVDCLRIAAPNEPEAQFDYAWLDGIEASNRNETHRLTAELKGYKNNLIKESVRMGNEDLGKHLESIGDLNGAAEAYSRMRPDVSTPKHLVDVGKHLVRVALQRREWSMVNAHLAKMGGHQGPEDEKALQPYLKITQGIAYLGLDQYHEAALSFLAADAGVPSTAYNEIASANDVAVYGGLLALASMERTALQNMVLDNSTFRTFLELEPHIRRAVTQFVNGRYSACIATLEAHKSDYLLDIYLQKHIPKIYSKIRSKCIVQYLIPFSCVTLDTMSTAFGHAGQSIEDELVTMIRDGSLKARINTIDRLVTTVSADPRGSLQSSALKTAQDYKKQAIDRLRRMSLAAAELELKGVKKTTGQHALGGGNEIMYDESVLV
ncbi:26S proteasome subunit RPN7-domain-containing protein [Cercophora newfieldiana]|uniref:COP9 signalosome complex subunit 1 n=1 Tax=Cercophora newfieldiana TaxID=92897 RepID=A0AA39Y5U6_9PEZI|nr:26S proteasome subunit RPN7-domain-containing protein [Cercophora newfieldiana]